MIAKDLLRASVDASTFVSIFIIHSSVVCVFIDKQYIYFKSLSARVSGYVK